MPMLHPGRQAELRMLIQTFLTERLTSKLESLPPDDPKRASLHAQFSFSTWIDDAAKRSAQIQCATHTLKAIHPDARGTSLYVSPPDLPGLEVVGSHSLGGTFTDDVVGNAAALDVFKFLKLTLDGRTLLQMAQSHDADLAAAFSDDREQARGWMILFAALAQPRGTPATHGYAKQLYWCTTNDARSDADFHLLAPLFGSALAHPVWQTLQEHRFGDAAKEARQARKDGRLSDIVVHEYPNLAVRKMGGTKPQNISQLNSERGGNNPLLASLPPLWQTREQPPLTPHALMAQFLRRPQVGPSARRLRAFLESNPRARLATRDYRDALVFDLIDEWLQLTAAIRIVTPGWSQDPNCSLSPAQKHWLDPEGVARAAAQAESPLPNATDTIDAVVEDFARWLNDRLRDPLPTGDDEFLYWRKLAREELAHDAWLLKQEASDVACY